MSPEDESRPTTSTDTAASSSDSLEERATRFVGQIRALAHDHLELAVLETRLTVTTVLGMAVVAIATALVLASTWLALAGAGALGLIKLGLAPSLAMLLVAATNLVLALAGWLRIRHMSRLLGWPATQRAIKPTPDHTAPDDETPRGDA